MRIEQEYMAATARGGLLRRTSISLIEASGPDTIDFLQGMVTADVKSLAPGTSTRAAILDIKGRILADLFLHRRDNSIFIETDDRTLTCSRVLNQYLIMEDVTLKIVLRHTALCH